MTSDEFNLAQPLPPLRQGIEAIQTEQDGKPLVVIHDQEGINENSVALSLPGFLIAMMFNGKNTIPQIQTAFSKATGSLISPDEIKNLVKDLDKSLLLETPTVAQKRKQILEEFQHSSVRKAVHKGGAYPEQSLELASFMGNFFQDSKGPKKQISSSPIAPPPVGLVAPHIDLHRGGPSYAWAYQALSECTPPDVIVALGVAHMSPNSPWVASQKEYETPYGPMKVDKAVYDRLTKHLWYKPEMDEWVHRREHSLEFQALWLRYLWREKTPPWIPLLCSSFDRFCPDKAPSRIATIDMALQQMGEELAKFQREGKRVMVLAGIDLAHVGPRFGDELELTPELGKKVESEDLASLELAKNGEADAFYLSVVKDDHWRKVCGLSALYTALRLIQYLAPTSKGQLLSYGQAPDPLGGLVSFTSLIYPR